MMGSQQTGFEEALTQLPILNASDFKAYNRLADHMDTFHNNFRRMWNEIYSVCSDNKRSSHQSIHAFLKLAESFCTQLTLHHTIEERHFSPELAARMPEFREELIGQHREIHHGLDNMHRYVKKCRTGESELQLSHLRGLMESFGEVLWAHLDGEVRALGAENMRKY
ncbi:uncharacterized protein EAE97_006473 [Botrytis byssoidea]|uniref:Hemerythrin-like domain-containing protein n=1 Tax=Botrytis byssoidea TaxID=139641 RepID=A0A9P5IP88_9HELO|nr:uncharacterized protein EAE97_006473 [Botrytis byssoidea]KAF7941636.1 hypothetical protein EAE97_006473 [Botrytis byssoidea]